MSQIVKVTLSTAGVDSGPFNIYQDADGYVTPVATAISRTVMTTTGYDVTVDSGATIVKVLSTGVCDNYDLIPISATTTTTTSTSTSTTTSTSTSTTTSTTSTTTANPPNVFLEYINGAVGSNTWNVRYTGVSSVVLAATIAAPNSTTTSVYNAGPFGISSGTVVTIQVRKTSDTGNMEDATSFELFVDSGSGFISVGVVNLNLSDNPIGPTSYRNITVGLGNQVINPGDKIKLVITEG